jgi:hypothetical protein
MLLWAHMSSQSSVEHVTVSRQSDEGKLPLILQVRVLEPFKKGTLVLAPAYGEIVDPKVDFKKAPSQGVVHDAMLSKVELTVIAGNIDRRRKASVAEVTRTSFDIHSPLLAFKNPKSRSTCMDNLSPFWALLRCASQKSCFNMDLEILSFSDAGCDLKGIKYPKVAKGVGFAVEIPIARNSCNVEKGDILCLPFLAE